MLNQTMHILSFLLCTLAVATSNENPPYKFCCPTVGECSLVDVSKYHLYGENSQALEEWNLQNRLDVPRNCPSNGAFNSKSPITELVMMASSRCRDSYYRRYYIETFRDHTNNSIYRLDIATGNPQLDRYYLMRRKHCTSKSTILDREGLTGDYPEGFGSSFTTLVTSKNLMTEAGISDSNADVLVRVEPVGYNDGVIYTVYNTTNGTDFCTQKYVPILAEYVESEISQCVNGTWLTVEWTGRDHSDGYIVVVGDSCTAQKPCSIVKNTTKVKIKFFTDNLFSTLAMKIRIYNIITTNCTNSEIGYELAHLFKGCRDECCDDSQYYHDPTLVMKATTEPSNGTTIATPMSDCDTTEGSISSTTLYPTHTHIKNSSTMATNSRTVALGANLPTAIATIESSNGTTVTAPIIAAVLIMFFTMLLIALIST